MLLALVGAANHGVMMVPMVSAALLGECVPMESKNGGVIYISKMAMGSPLQYFHVVPDTGSFSLVAPSTLCQSSECSAHAKFNPASSSTYFSDGKRSGLAYGSGKIQVMSAKDNVQLGQHFSAGVDAELITSAAYLNNYAQAPYDGIMGLGKRQDTTKFGPTAIDQKPLLTALNVKKFTMCLGSQHVSGVDKCGRLMLDEDLEPEISRGFVSLATKGETMWAAGLTSAQTISAHATKGKQLIDTNVSVVGVPDSGTSLLTFPPWLFSSLMDEIEAGCPFQDCIDKLSEQSTCSGEIFDKLPNLGLTFGGVDISLAPKT